MRTTIRLEDDLLHAAKAEANATGRSLTAVISDALRASLSARDAPLLEPVSLTTFRGRGTLPGVDLDDSAALADAMDDRAPR